MWLLRPPSRAQILSRLQDIPPLEVPGARIKIRVDFHVARGELDFSFLAWSQPGSVLIANEQWAHYDRFHIGMAATDMVANVYSVIRSAPDPFP